MAAVEPFEPDALESALSNFVQAEGVKTSDVIHTVRVAVTCKPVGPGLYDCLAILGRDTCLARIDRAAARAAEH